MSAISIAEENIFYNYDDSEASSVTFSLSNNNKLTLYFPEQQVCYLIAEDPTRRILTAAAFRSRFKCPIGFVPILGPVDHNEKLYEKEAARLALFNYRAARNFRNIWYHYSEHFDSFRTILRQTWPGMDIEPPKVDMSYDKPVLHMFCPEERIPREIVWAGFGFQVWCQMLTHLVQSSSASLFLIDEPDIYLHADLQRQLLGLLRNLGPDILIATHSTEIITEAETDDIILVNKRRRHARRIKDPAELAEVFTILGSNLNPILTQLAKTRRVVFVEGKDFQVLGRFARKLNLVGVGNRSNFAVVPVDGFNPDRIRSLKRGMETTLGESIAAAAILDRDYRSDEECKGLTARCQEFCDLVAIHRCKEVENFLLVPAALDRAATRRIVDRSRRTSQDVVYSDDAASLLEDFASDQKSYVTSQYLARRRQYERRNSPAQDEAATNQAALEELESDWAKADRRRELIPGKEALGFLNQYLDQKYHVSITSTGIVDAMRADEIPAGMVRLLQQLTDFSSVARRVKNHAQAEAAPGPPNKTAAH